MAFALLRRTLVPFLRLRVQVDGLDHLPAQGPYILAANHQSYLDPPIVWLAVVPTVKEKLWFVTTEYVWRGLKKVFGKRGIDWLGILPLLTDDKAKVLDLGVQQLARGGRVVIFPEGTRNRRDDSVLLKGKTGAARLALATGAPVVPMGIIAPPGLTTGQAIRNFFFSRHPAVVHVGAPLTFTRAAESVTKERLEAVTAEIMNAIAPLCGKQVAS